MLKKAMPFIAVLLMAALCLSGCQHQHDWTQATCTEAAVCKECGETQGEPLGHDWAQATCTEPKTCTRCGKTTGSPAGHQVTEWITETEASCTAAGVEKGVCTACGETLSQEIPQAPHTEGEWIVTQEATFEADGERALTCSVCGGVIRTEKIALTAEEKKAAFTGACQRFSYDEIARNPDGYKQQKAVFQGEVVQVMESGNTVVLRVNVTKGKYSIWEDTVYVTYQRTANEGRILEDDIITMYGYLTGSKTYETIFGGSVTIPSMTALYIDVN
ncbi:hypothetical protein H8699_02865 [Christensenellaceae bacterium NSJ-44]|uniref:Lipoprotein n=1 Tax=Luoshenia tenuis TaxID=2763654 RepID=A0A926HM95_9FIRM|nr:hypothetical protein [Luoshenia tenuis]MBC8528380.1 hypothetical protein [Luoshenia tenuis]